MQRSQLSIYPRLELTLRGDIPFCARTGPFYDVQTRSVSDDWLIDIPGPCQAIVVSTERQVVEEGLRLKRLISRFDGRNAWAT